MEHKDAGSNLVFSMNFWNYWCKLYVNLPRDKQFILEFTQGE